MYDCLKIYGLDKIVVLGMIWWIMDRVERMLWKYDELWWMRFMDNRYFLNIFI